MDRSGNGIAVDIVLLADNVAGVEA